MRLVFAKYDLEIELSENSVINLVLENQSLFSEMVWNLCCQIDGGEGGIVLSEVDKILPIAKNIELISNPFMINCNDRKISSHIYKELQARITEELFAEFSNVNGQLLSFVDKSLELLPYPLVSNLDVDIIGLLKLFDVKVDEPQAEDILEKLCSYLKLINSVCNISVVIFINLKHYLLPNQLTELYKFCFYEKIKLLNIEGVRTDLYDDEKCVIIDKDFCKIII